MRKLSQILLFLLFSLTAGAVLAGPVDINTADADTLSRELDGVGNYKAREIVEYRRTHGPFKSPEDLAKVKGIGLKTVEKNRDKLRLRKTTATR